MDFDRWVGTDEHSALPSLVRPDAPRSRWSLEAIAATERPTVPAISPDGSTVAFVLHRDTSDVWTVPVSGGHSTRVTTNRGVHVYWWETRPAWSPDGTRLAYTNDGAVWVTLVAGGEVRRLHEGDNPAWIDDQTILITIERDKEARLAIIRLDDPWARAITPRGQDVSSARLVTGGGAIVYVNYPKNDRKASEIWWADLEGDARKLTGVPGMHDLSPAVSPDGSTLVFTSERDGRYHLYALDLASQTERRLTAEAADFGEVSWHPDGSRVVAIRSGRGRCDLVTVGFPNGEVKVLSPGGEWSSPAWAVESVVALHEDHRTAPRLVRVDADGSITALTGPPPAEVASAPHVPFEEVTYPSFDGLEIHGFLFKPRQASDHAVPAVVYPHGGPIESYNDAWDPHAQYFIDKGYAWLAINFRGSTGYGRDFERGNHGLWGVADTEDCLAAGDYLAAVDWVDEKRIAIFGASYGSYMALCSLTRDPRHRYACGVLKYGDSEIARSWAQGSRGGHDELVMMMGTPSEERVSYREGSPLWELANLIRPLLIIHGEKDDVVHPDQSAQLVAELKRLGKTYEYITYPSEAHGLMRIGPQIHFHRRMERFLDWHLM